MSANDPAIRARIARIGGHAAQAKHGGAHMTEAARTARQTALNARLIEQYGIDITTAAGAQQLTSARSAYYGQMAMRRTK